MAESQVDIFTQTIKWEELAPLPVCRAGHTAVLFDGVVYVGGGFEGTSDSNKHDCYRLDVYNLANNQWSPSPITTPYKWFAMTVLDDKLVIAGGRTKSNEVVKKVLMLNGGQWKDYSEMPTARYSATAVGYHSMLIVAGGGVKVKEIWTRAIVHNFYYGFLSRVSTTELLDTTSGCWYTCSNLPSPHQQMKAVIMNDKLYLLGGYDKDLKSSLQVFVASLDILSTHQLNWQSAVNSPWYGSAPVVMYNKLVLTIGGEQQSNTSEVNFFDPSTGEWKYLTNIPAASRSVAAVGVADNVIVIGGVTTDNKYSNKVWIGRYV